MADLQDADYCLRELLVVSDTDTLKAEKALQEGLAAFDGFQWDTAIEAFRKAMTADANCRSACAKLAQAFAVRGQVKNSLEALYHVMDLFEAEDDLPGVIETANRILELYPDNDQARLKLVIAYHMLGNISEALRESRELAILYQEQGRGEEALNLLQRAKTLDPNSVDIHVEYAEAHITHGHIKEGSAALIAVADLCLALEAKRLENPPLEPAVVDPEDEPFVVKPVVSLPRRAIESLRRLKLLQPQDIQIPLRIADILGDIGAVDEAEQELRAALRLDLANARALMGLANICLKKGQYRDAQLVLTRLIQGDPAQVEGRVQLAELYLHQNQMAEAVSTYEALARWCLENRDRDRARLYFKKVLELAPDNSVAKHHLSTLGEAVPS